MSVREEFDEWAADGRDRGMEERHWHTAKHVLARMPVEGRTSDHASEARRERSEGLDEASGEGRIPSDQSNGQQSDPREDSEGDTVLDLGSGSGYAARAMRDNTGASRVYGLDGSPKMARNARSYTDDPTVGFLIGDFEHLPFADDGVDHAFSMEAFYYASDPDRVLQEMRRILRPGGTFFCAVNYYEENVHSHEWQDRIDVEMTRWSRAEYREAFRDAGLYVAEQDNVPDRDIEIPPESAFPTDEWDAREEMVERYREFGTLLTVGVAP